MLPLFGARSIAIGKRDAGGSRPRVAKFGACGQGAAEQATLAAFQETPAYYDRLSTLLLMDLSKEEDRERVAGIKVPEPDQFTSAMQRPCSFLKKKPGQSTRFAADTRR